MNHSLRRESFWFTASLGFMASPQFGRSEWFMSRVPERKPRRLERVVRGHIMYFVYVLLSLKDQKFYIGFTSNLENRLKDHHAGRNTSTKSRRPFQLVYYEAHLSKEDAQRRERYFKSTKGKVSLKQMLRASLNELQTSHD